MISRASGLGVGVGRFSRWLREVGAIAMPDARLDTTRCVEVSPGASVLRLLVPGVVVWIFVHRHCVADGVEVTH